MHEKGHEKRKDSKKEAEAMKLKLSNNQMNGEADKYLNATH